KLLEKLLNDEVRVYKRTNLVKSEEFSSMMKSVMPPTCGTANNSPRCV
ncbi:MAG: DUF3387 domain-containing protein, partial [Clostridia bacterium]|nr:DUF3387 domain-containing protein [Clostridia bacterium]